MHGIGRFRIATFYMKSRNDGKKGMRGPAGSGPRRLLELQGVQPAVDSPGGQKLGVGP
jgi:hypothetical protein